MQASYYRNVKDKLQCMLCPHYCMIQPDETGRCRIRKNTGNKLSLPYWGKLSSMAIDPIEKKPLYNFHPGEMIFSVGFWGCNFACPFCQNYQISQHVDISTPTVSPSQLIQQAINSGSFGIAYTYSEPLVHFEYVLECCKLSREAGLKNVLVTNGFINKEPAEALFPWVDAANIDIKSSNKEYYRNILQGDFDKVIDTVKLAANSSHVEVTTLIIQGDNDSDEEFQTIVDTIANIDSQIPFHISAYFPRYKYKKPATNSTTILDLVKKAKQKLHYVYPGNILKNS